MHSPFFFLKISKFWKCTLVVSNPYPLAPRHFSSHDLLNYKRNNPSYCHSNVLDARSSMKVWAITSVHNTRKRIKSHQIGNVFLIYKLHDYFYTFILVLIAYTLRFNLLMMQIFHLEKLKLPKLVLPSIYAINYCLTLSWLY